MALLVSTIRTRTLKSEIQPLSVRKRMALARSTIRLRTLGSLANDKWDKILRPKCPACAQKSGRPNWSPARVAVSPSWAHLVQRNSLSPLWELDYGVFPGATQRLIGWRSGFCEVWHWYIHLPALRGSAAPVPLNWSDPGTYLEETGLAMPLARNQRLILSLSTGITSLVGSFSTSVFAWPNHR